MLLHSRLPVHWVNKDILVSGEVRICSPYHDDCVTGGTATARDQIKAVVSLNTKVLNVLSCISL